MAIVGAALLLAGLTFFTVQLFRPSDRHLCLRCRTETETMYGYLNSRKELRSFPYIRDVSPRLKDICSVCGNSYLRFKE